VSFYNLQLIIIYYQMRQFIVILSLSVLIISCQHKEVIEDRAKRISDSLEQGKSDSIAKRTKHINDSLEDLQWKLKWNEAQKANETEKANEKLATKHLKANVARLFNSLMSFKNNSDFHTYGFSTGYKYNSWLKEVQSLKTSPAAGSFLSECGFVIGDLEMLGLEYATSGGRETEYSRYTSKMIKDGLKGIKNYE
jgi:hypothetical protein